MATATKRIRHRKKSARQKPLKLDRCLITTFAEILKELDVRGPEQKLLALKKGPLFRAMKKVVHGYRRIIADAFFTASELRLQRLQRKSVTPTTPTQPARSNVNVRI